MSPWLDAMNPESPVTFTAASTLGSASITLFTCSWIAFICAGDEPSRPMNTPVTTLLSPIGRNAFGTTRKSPMVPARQATQMSAETERCSRNHQSELP